MTVAEYVRTHSHSILAARLAGKFGATSRREIHIGSGLIAPSNKGSNLGRLMARYEMKHYTTGGRAGKNRTEGYWFAVHR